MSKWRVAILVILVAAPAVFLVGSGISALWQGGWSIWFLSVPAASFILGVMLARYWRRQQPQETISAEQDAQALRLVEARAAAADKVEQDKLLDWHFYVATAQELAQEMAQCYHPGSTDFYGSVTVPEILVVIELVARDMSAMVNRLVPAGHLMTINDWKRAGSLSKNVYKLGEAALTVYKAVKAVFSPYAEATRFIARKLGYKSPAELIWPKLKQDMLVSLYTTFLERLGEYLIAVNSGRLREGAEQYLRMQELQAEDGEDSTEVVVTEAGHASAPAPQLPGVDTAQPAQMPRWAESRRRAPLTKGRALVLVCLLATPLVFLAACGAYQAWLAGWWSWLWWAMAGSAALAMLLGWYWQRQHKLVRVEFKPELYWSERDLKALELVKARAQAANQIQGETLLEPVFYFNTAEEMAKEMVHFYQPTATDYRGSFTMPEILAVVELVAHDLRELVDYLPGGHQMTVNDWKLGWKLFDWYDQYSILSWAIYALLDPIGTALRYLASEVGISLPWTQLRHNLLLWFYTAFLQRLGTYLIDLNSGRLRVGASRYRELLRGQPPAPVTPDLDDRTEVVPAPDGTPTVGQVTITLLGEVKAGKSSVVNAILGEQRARTNVLPETREITRYDLKHERISTRLSLLDTVGYGHSGPRQDQLAATQDAAQKSDLLLLVLHARNPARQPDVEMLQALRAWFTQRPDHKMPRVLGVLTHIDLLSPGMEWQPPYNWLQPARVKEKQIAEAVAAVREQLGEWLVGVVPVCVAEGKVYGVNEWLMPAVMELLDEAHALAMLRVLRAEIDIGKVRKVFDQFLEAGKQTARILWEAATR
jgi:predicted GTPase/membrane protein implicated in regulation of membrane protease activity